MAKLPLLLVAALLLTAAPRALAQTAASVSLGLSFGARFPTESAVDGDNGPGVILRLRGHGGLGPSIGFNWISPKVRRTIAGQPTWLGEINVRPLMAGATYTWERARMMTGVSFEAGPAFVNIRDTGAAKRAYEQRLGARRVGIHAANTLAWATGLSTWFDLGSRFGLVASIGYVGVRPRVTTESSLGTTRERVNLGSITTSLGIVCGVF